MNTDRKIIAAGSNPVSKIGPPNSVFTSLSRLFSKIYWTLGVRVSVYNQLLTLLRLPYFEPGGREFESLRARHSRKFHAGLIVGPALKGRTIW